jgi:hypothetical protein
LENAIYAGLLNLSREFPGFNNLSVEQRYLLGCGDPDQFNSTLKTLLEPGEDCVFCRVRKGLEDPLFETEDWFLRGNDFPKRIPD